MPLQISSEPIFISWDFLPQSLIGNSVHFWSEYTWI